MLILALTLTFSSCKKEHMKDFPQGNQNNNAKILLLSDSVPHTWRLDSIYSGQHTNPGHSSAVFGVTHYDSISYYTWTLSPDTVRYYDSTYASHNVSYETYTILNTDSTIISSLGDTYIVDSIIPYQYVAMHENLTWNAGGYIDTFKVSYYFTYVN